MKMFLFAVCVFGLSATGSAAESGLVAAPQAVSVQRIWDSAQHSAFTDLVRWQDTWWCTFREGSDHAGGEDGVIRVITSGDGETWESAALLAEAGVDLRDPKISVMPDNRLLLVMGGSVYREGKFITRQPRVAFSSDGRTWSAPEKVLAEQDWLWRVTWHDGVAYGFSYGGDREADTWFHVLYRSADGRTWQRVGESGLPGRVNETTVRFLDDGTMMALVREESGRNLSYLGSSPPPYAAWTWKELSYRLGGPEFIQGPDGTFWAGSRRYASGPSRTVVARVTADAYLPVLLLPSGGDNSYPGMVWHEGRLWMSYYASHEGKSSIYLARLALPEDGSLQAPRYSGVPSEQFMRTWLLCGPFPAGEPATPGDERLHFTQFDTDWLGGEGDAAPQPGDVVKLADQQRNWLTYSSDEDAVDLDLAVTQEAASVAYAYAEIEAAQRQPLVLALGSNDGVRVWLNGEMIHDVARARGLRLDEDVVALDLKPGVNRLLLKIEERAGSWGFAARLLALDSPLVRARLGLFEVEPQRHDRPLLRVRQQVGAILKAHDQVQLRVLPMDSGEAVWEGPWDGASQMPLPLPEGTQGYLRLESTLTLDNGEKIQETRTFLTAIPEVHTLFTDGQSDYQIVLGAEASAPEQWAARELQHWLREISGIELPILQDDAALPEHAILVGWSPQLAGLLGGEAAQPADADERFTYRSFGPTVAIWGGRDRGTMYGVFSFLEREFGCRWYTPRVTITPERARYTFTGYHHTEAPLIRVRNNFYHEAFEPVWAARNRVNGSMGHREQIGGVESYWGVHTFYPLVPPEEFFEGHPEYYSLIDGKRVWDHAQLCLTNPEVLNILTERLRERMRNQPHDLIYDVSQNDWRNPCQCNDCQAIALAEESEAGPVLWFVNQVAERLQEEFPDKYIGTLAYQYTRKAPKTIRPRENVVVRLCSIECCFAHDFNNCPENESFLQDLEDWKAIAPKLYIWDYVVNFSHYLQPHPNFQVLAPNLRAFAEHNAIGVMEQAAYQSRGGEFAELRMYVISRLLWDYTQDVDPIVDDFMYGYYGRGGQYVRAYFDLLHEQITPDTHIYFNSPILDKMYSEHFVRKAQQLFEKAEKVAENEEVLQRIELASLPVLYLKCKLLPIEAKHDGTYAKFTRISNREGVTHYAEHGKPHRDAFHADMEALP